MFPALPEKNEKQTGVMMDLSGKTAVETEMFNCGERIYCEI